MTNRKYFFFTVSTLILLSACGVRNKIQNNEVFSPQPTVEPLPKQPEVESVQSKEANKKKEEKSSGLWGDVEYDGIPWVTRESKAHTVTQGLQRRHISVTPSHGRYYDQQKLTWKWQRPYLFGTTEDLFTQTIVLPFLVPMLENAGANVFVARERDWQRNEFIVDNDDHNAPFYSENNSGAKWKDAGASGFSWKKERYHDGENPFLDGTTRMVQASKDGHSSISYQPDIPESGSYAVYVSYPTLENSIPDAKYTVHHKGQETVFRVNQQMGGSTWVYLGTFNFDKGCNQFNRVVLSNESNHKGFVTADAVRFGGGMGNVERGGEISGMPRCLEGSRYFAQWAGVPYNVYSFNQGSDDYRDDIYSRPNMTNWLAGGSCYLPDSVGKKVPIELSLAVHSDAGFHRDYKSVYGTLSICTTNLNDGFYDSGISRSASSTFAYSLLDGLQRDLDHKYGKWVVRKMMDRNYAESRTPEMPSAILETLSHQSFPDMIYAQDPRFRFWMARSIYKTILKFVSEAHGANYVVAPLPPKNIRSEFTSHNEIVLKWDAQHDELEKTAKPNSYIVYKKIGVSDFDNGTLVKGTSYKLSLRPGVIYSFKVTAVNKGGESFPTETVSALHNTGATRSILIINNFHRLSAPAVYETATEQGFDFDIDPGVSYGKTAGWSGRQICFDKKKIGIEGPGGLGYSSGEWEGKFFAGNDFDYPYTHVEAMKGLLNCNISSCSSQAVETGKVDLMKYHLIDIIQGLQKNDRNAFEHYPTFTRVFQEILTKYTRSGGALFVSGSYIGSDATTKKDSIFLNDVLKVSPKGFIRNPRSNNINGMGTSFDFYNELNEEHYAATSVDILMPGNDAYTALTYDNGSSAGVAYHGSDYHVFTMGLPFECITSYRKRAAIMKGIVGFLLNE